MKNIRISLTILVIIFTMFLIACDKQDIGPAFVSPEISFEPEMSSFSGKEGDMLKIKVKVSSENGEEFSSLQLKKKKDKVVMKEEYLLELKDERYPTPYEFNYEYEITADDVGQPIVLSFVLEAIHKTPSGGTAYSYSPKDIEIHAHE